MPSPTSKPAAFGDAFDQFARSRYFAALDGLRAASVLLVITAHLHSEAWRPLFGGQGVTAFFVLSGFIITTLLVREEDRHGRIGLRGFYVRRAFRILPLYGVILGVYVVAVLGLGIEPDKRDGLEYALPYYLTFTNELALYGDAFRNQIPFYQSWSLGVEEKFYLLWPLLGFVFMGRAGRLPALAAVTGAVCAVQIAADANWPQWYAPILVGCVLGLLLHDRRAFGRLAVLGRHGSVLLAVASIVTLHVVLEERERLGEVLYPFAVAALIVGLVTGASPVRRALGGRAVRYVGTRAYGIYLVHILAINAVDRLVLPDTTFSGATLLNALLVVVLSLGAADVLHRIVERPCIAAGRRVAGRFGPRTPPGTSSGALPAAVSALGGSGAPGREG